MHATDITEAEAEAEAEEDGQEEVVEMAVAKEWAILPLLVLLLWMAAVKVAVESRVEEK